MVARTRHQRDVGNPVESFDRMRSEWRSGVRSRHRPTPRGLPSDGASGDWHYANEHEFLRSIELFRHYERNDPVVNAALSRLTSNVCQGGFTLDPQTGDDDVDRYIQQRWTEWSGSPAKCDRRGRLTFNQIVELVFRSAVRDGDCCVVPLKSGTLKIYEAHRLRTPTGTKRNVVHGILLDDHRRPIEYWFTREPIEPLDALTRVGDTTQVKARDGEGNPQVFHVSRPTRESQARGASWLAPAVDVTEMHHGIQFAKMVQQQTVSCYSLITKRGKSFRPEDDDADGAARKSRDEYLRNLHVPLQDIVPGTIYDALPDEELIGFSPNVPNEEFFSHAQLLLTFFAINIDLPLAVLLLDPSQTNFSGWRGAIEQARIAWKQIQRWLIGQLHTPVYLDWLRRLLATDSALRDAEERGVDLYKHAFNPPAWAYIEPEKDARAQALQLHTGAKSRRKLKADLGESYDDDMPAVFDELKSELLVCVDIADEVNRAMKGKQAGKPLDIREVAIARGTLPNPNLTTLSAPVDEASGKQKTAEGSR